MLVFFSGSDRVPSLGFGVMPKLSFLYGNEARLYTSSTCEVRLRLPTCHGENYEAFREAMIMSLKCNDGFGGVQFQCAGRAMERTMRRSEKP